MNASRLFLVIALTLCMASWSAALAQETVASNHPKYVTAREVFDDLARAFGDGRTRPELRMLRSGVTGSNPAVWFTPDRNLVTLEEQAYDLCASIGADSLDALAFLLGHELVHYYRDHGWVHAFASSAPDLGVGQQLGERVRDPAERVRIETEADYHGGFFGYIAGYRALEAVGEILPRIYAAYELDENLSGYPSLPERQEIARRAGEELDHMVPVFEAGHHLLLVKRYEEAARCFDFIARTFASREILNNAGAARALEALDLFEEGELAVAYPFELDAETRLRRGRKAAEHGEEVFQRQRDRLLREARDAFERSRQKDPAYLPAWVNLAAVADLQREYEEADYLANRAVRVARQTGEEAVPAHALIVRGIARVHTGDRAGARQDFTAAESGAPSLARLNLAGLDGGKPTVPAGREERVARPEAIDGATPRNGRRIVDDPALVSEVPGIDRSQPAMDIYSRQTDVWSGLVVETGYSTFSFLETRPSFSGRTERDIRIGHDQEQVQAAYGLPAYLVAGRQGTHHVYEQSRIIFRLDEAGSVRGWVLYSIE